MCARHGTELCAAGASDLPQRFAAQGTVSLVEAQLPAKVFYDAQDGYLRLDIEWQPETAHVVIDWSQGRSGTYLFTGSRCHNSRVPVAAASSVSEVKEVQSDDILAAVERPGDSLQFVRLEGAPHFVIETSPFLLVVRLEGVAAAQEISREVKVPQPCPHLQDWGGKLYAKGGEEGAQGGPPAVAADAWIRENGKFHSWSVKYVDPPFLSSYCEYKIQREKCEKDKDCRVRYDLTVKYGWHCGPGWGQGQPYWLDPTDAVCRYHDARKWGLSDKENWCGMWSALICWSQSGWMAWSY